MSHIRPYRTEATMIVFIFVHSFKTNQHPHFYTCLIVDTTQLTIIKSKSNFFSLCFNQYIILGIAHIRYLVVMANVFSSIVGKIAGLKQGVVDLHIHTKCVFDQYYSNGGVCDCPRVL